jgi:hypothetical protein
MGLCASHHLAVDVRPRVDNLPQVAPMTVGHMKHDVEAFLEDPLSWPHTTGVQWDAMLQAVRNGVCVNTRSTEGIALLHVASGFGPKAAVRTLLVELGANPSIETWRGWRPMHLAAFTGRLAICKLLPRTDLAMRVPCERWWFTPLGLAIACARNYKELAQWCVDQPECPLDDTYYTYNCEEIAATTLPVIGVAKEQRRRWSPLRAAFVGAVARVEPPQGFTRAQYNVV